MKRRPHADGLTGRYVAALALIAMLALAGFAVLSVVSAAEERATGLVPLVDQQRDLVDHGALFADELDRELARAGRHDRPLCVGLLDLDRFKAFNDQRGHQAGDRLLREAAPAWRSALGRPTDVLARDGGEEFVVLLPETDLMAARAALDRVRLATPGGQTCSIGIAQWTPGETTAQWIGRADAALYDAKDGGRDRLALAISAHLPSLGNQRAREDSNL